LRRLATSSSLPLRAHRIVRTSHRGAKPGCDFSSFPDLGRRRLRIASGRSWPTSRRTNPGGAHFQACRSRRRDRCVLSRRTGVSVKLRGARLMRSPGSATQFLTRWSETRHFGSGSGRFSVVFSGRKPSRRRGRKVRSPCRPALLGGDASLGKPKPWNLRGRGWSLAGFQSRLAASPCQPMRLQRTRTVLLKHPLRLRLPLRRSYRRRLCVADPLCTVPVQYVFADSTEPSCSAWTFSVYATPLLRSSESRSHLEGGTRIPQINTRAKPQFRA
jgi:hypothetical protein